MFQIILLDGIYLVTLFHDAQCRVLHTGCNKSMIATSAFSPPGSSLRGDIQGVISKTHIYATHVLSFLRKLEMSSMRIHVYTCPKPAFLSLSFS